MESQLMVTRVISGLKFANPCSRPLSIGISRPRGAKAHGIRYEKNCAKGLPLARHGQWWQYVDSNGLGVCQTDLVLEFEACAVVLEAKYTWTPQGHFQCEKLYQPVVSKALGKPAFGLVICRALRDEAQMGDVMVASRLMEALAWCQRKRVALHWLGEVPMLKLDPATRLGPAIPPHAPVLVPARRAS